MSETLLEAARIALHHASVVNPESPNRRRLRALLRYHELPVMEALLVLERVAQLDPSRGPMDIAALVRDAHNALVPFYVEAPR